MSKAKGGRHGSAPGDADDPQAHVPKALRLSKASFERLRAEFLERKRLAEEQARLSSVPKEETEKVKYPLLRPASSQSRRSGYQSRSRYEDISH